MGSRRRVRLVEYWRAGPPTELCRVAQRGPRERSRARATAPSRWSSAFPGAGAVKIDRRRTRDIALKVLFQHDVGHVPIHEALQFARRDDEAI